EGGKFLYLRLDAAICASDQQTGGQRFFMDIQPATNGMHYGYQGVIIFLNHVCPPERDCRGRHSQRITVVLFFGKHFSSLWCGSQAMNRLYENVATVFSVKLPEAAVGSSRYDF